MLLCDQSLVTLAFLWEKLSSPQFYKDLTRKTVFFNGCSWFNLELALGTNFKFYTSGEKRLKLKVRKFWGLILTFAEVTVGKLVVVPFCKFLANGHALVYLARPMLKNISQHFSGAIHLVHSHLRGTLHRIFS